MEFSDIVKSVQDIIQDAFWTETKIKSLVNEALRVVSQGVMYGDPLNLKITPPLPDLFVTATLAATSAGAGVVAMPTDFNRDLVQVVNADGDNVAVDYSFKRFLLKNFEKKAGTVTSCSRHGNSLYYRDIPAASESLTVYYYKSPTTLSADDDEATVLPEILHRPVLVGYPCAEIFKQIEDGIEGKKVNSEFWINEFKTGLMENLALIVGHDSGPNNYDISGATK